MNTQIFNSAFLANVMWALIVFAIVFTYHYIQKRKREKHVIQGPAPSLGGPVHISPEEFDKQIKANAKRRDDFEAAQDKFIKWVNDNCK